MKVLCIGHSTYDIVIPVDNYPKENTKNRTNDILYCGGGPAANAAYLLGKWCLDKENIDTYFCGLVGDDYEGKYIEAEFKSVCVNTDYLVKDKTYDTTKSYIIVNKTNASRTSIAIQKSNKCLNDLSIDIKPDMILIDGHEVELSKKIIRDNPDAIVVIDAGRCNSYVVELCHESDYIVCSHDFAEEYTGSSDLSMMLNKLKSDFSGEIVITLEDKGCVYYDDGLKMIKSIPTKAVDTTGAGDIFHGAFMYGLINKWDKYKILTFASTTAGLSVTHMTGRKSVFPLNIVEDTYNELRKCNFY